jgi:universal stress protein E
MELNKVLVVIEPDTETQPALEKVLVLARLQSFSIKLISVDYTQYLVEGYYFDAVDLPSLRADYLAERKQSLELLAAPLREQGLEVETSAVWGHPGYQVITREGLDTDLIIVHTRRHAAVSRLFLSNDDWQLVRCCPSPLLLVKEKPWKDQPVVVAAVDPMHTRKKPQGLDHKILNVSQQAANLLGGDVFAVHSYSEVPLSGTYLEQAKAQHREAFETLMTDFDIPASRQHLVEEAPEYGLPGIERNLQADIVVMGAISRSFVADIFIGNTTEKVLDYLECDVLVLKPDDYVSPLAKH